MIAQTQRTILDAFSQGSSSRRPAVAMDQEATQLDSSLGGPGTPEPSTRLPAAFDVHILHQTTPCTLAVHSRSACRWQWVLMSSPQRLSQFASTPEAGLAQFLHKHGTALQEPSRCLLAEALLAAGHAYAPAASQTPMRVSIASPRLQDEMDLDTQLDLETQLDSISTPAAFSPPGVEEQTPSAPGRTAPAPVPAHLAQPLSSHGPHLQHMGLQHVPDTIAIIRADGKK
eukprot:1343896-Amphidinium_carterae.1